MIQVQQFDRVAVSRYNNKQIDSSHLSDTSKKLMHTRDSLSNNPVKIHLVVTPPFHYLSSPIEYGDIILLPPITQASRHLY
jgi:hypothetical protein